MWHSHVVSNHVQVITRFIKKQSHDRVFLKPWGPPPRIGCIDADLPTCANGLTTWGSRKSGCTHNMFHGLKAEADARLLLNTTLKAKLHERCLAFWCSNYRNLHLVCPMKMQNSDGLQILHSHLFRNRDSFKQINKRKLLQSSFWCCMRALNLPALSPPSVRRCPPCLSVRLTQAWCLLQAYRMHHQ